MKTSRRYNTKNHVLDFISDAHKFQNKWGITSSLDIDENTIVADISEDITNEPAGLIAEIQNICGEYLPRLIDWYQSNGDEKNLRRAKSLSKKFN